MFITPRLASSTSVTYNLTEHIGLILRYQNIYDYEPVVPIEELFPEAMIFFLLHCKIQRHNLCFHLPNRDVIM